MAAGRAAIAAGAVDAGIACLRRAVAESAAADDIILQIGDALIFDRSDLWLFTREHEAARSSTWCTSATARSPVGGLSPPM